LTFNTVADEASNASGRTWLLASGQLRVSEAGSGLEIAKRSFADRIGKQQLKTGTGGACAPLSEILPAARVARFVRMTKEKPEPEKGTGLEKD
jgi:hypothetical protein